MFARQIFPYYYNHGDVFDRINAPALLRPKEIRALRVQIKILLLQNQHALSGNCHQIPYICKADLSYFTAAVSVFSSSAPFTPLLIFWKQIRIVVLPSFVNPEPLVRISPYGFFNRIGHDLRVGY